MREPSAGTRMVKLKSVVRADWKKGIGKPSDLAVRLKLAIMSSESKKTTHTLVGVVGVPSPPKTEAERFCLVSLLLAKASVPHDTEVCILEWDFVDAPFGVTVEKFKPIMTIGDDSIIHLEVTHPPDPSPEMQRDLDEDELKKDFDRTKEWSRAYIDLPYLMFENREDLTLRVDALSRNSMAVNDDGKMHTVTDDAVWMNLLWDLHLESYGRGYPMVNTHSNRHPSVPYRIPRSWDRDVCVKAAHALQDCHLPPGALVKYGKKEFMRKMLERGELRVGAASDFESKRHNQAVRDKERELVFRGVFKNTDTGLMISGRDVPNGKLEDTRLTTFTPLRQSMLEAKHEGGQISNHNIGTATLNSISDYRMCCFSTVLRPDLFSDFEADACVIVVKPVKLINAMMRAMLYHMPASRFSYGGVRYMDPLGSYDAPLSLTHDAFGRFPTHLTKDYGFAYQKEWRMVWRPAENNRNLDVVDVEVGSMEGYAQLIVL